MTDKISSDQIPSATDTQSRRGLCSRFKVHVKLPGDEKSYLRFWANSPFDGGTAQNAWSVLEAQRVRVSPGEKTPMMFS